jgi:hypothetical protein
MAKNNLFAVKYGEKANFGERKDEKEQGSSILSSKNVQLPTTSTLRI